MLSVVMLSVVMLSVVMLNDVAHPLQSFLVECKTSSQSQERRNLIKLVTNKLKKKNLEGGVNAGGLEGSRAVGQAGQPFNRFIFLEEKPEKSYQRILITYLVSVVKYFSFLRTCC